MSFGKFFASCFTGSMLGAGPDVFAVWAYCISNAVAAQVELNPKLLALSIGMSVERVNNAIRFLCSPDPDSRNKEHDGKRLIKEGEFAYHVVSHDIYRAIRDEDGRREYMRKYMRDRRAKAKLKSVSDVSSGEQHKPRLAQAEAEAEAETEAESTAGAYLRAMPADDHDDIIGTVAPQPLPGHGRAAPADLAVDLRPLWLEIAKDHGPEVATKARDAAKRIFGAVTPARMRETFGEAYERKALELPADNWPDFRQRIKNDRAGLTNNAATDVDPAREAARRKRIAQIHGDTNDR